MTSSGAGPSRPDHERRWSGALDAGPPLAGVRFDLLDRHRDDRGWFVKLFQASAVEAAGGEPAVAEVFVSSSRRGVVRGMHFQEPPADHAKTVACLGGVIHDVVVDLRPGTDEHRVACYRLDGEAPARLHLPRGVAHGFQALSDEAIVCYVTSSDHDPGRDTGVRFDSIDVDWPLAPVAVSDRDRSFPALAEYRWPG